MMSAKKPTFPRLHFFEFSYTEKPQNLSFSGSPSLPPPQCGRHNYRPFAAVVIFVVAYVQRRRAAACRYGWWSPRQNKSSPLRVQHTKKFTAMFIVRQKSWFLVVVVGISIIIFENMLMVRMLKEGYTNELLVDPTTTRNQSRLPR